MPPNSSQDREIDQIVSSSQDEGQQIDRIAKIRGWFRPKDDSTYYPTIQAYIQGTANLEKTMATLTTHIDEAITANKLSKVKWLDLWYSIIHTSKRISYRDTSSHTKLIELIKAIKQHPDPVSSNPDKKTYERLPDFDMAQREAYNDSPGCGAGSTKPEISAWANYNYFLALLTKSSIVDVSLYAIWAIRAALEDKHENDARGLTEYDANVPAAAVWVIALGKELYDLEKDLRPSDPNAGNPARGGELWNGGAEFSKKRWAFWKKRFGELSELEGVKEETRRIASDAFNAMEKAEKE